MRITSAGIRRAGLIACGLVTAWLTSTGTVAQPSASGDVPLPELTDDDGSLDRQGLIGAVLESNRELAAARSAVEAARARADKVRGLPNLGASYSFGPLSIFKEGERYGQVIQVGQELPWPGTLDRRGEQAVSLAVAGEGELEALRRKLAMAASQGYDDYWYLERALDVNREHQELMLEFQAVATARYAAGIAPQQAPLAAEVEFAHLEHFEVLLKADREELIARLNRLLHRPAVTPLPAPAPGSALPADSPDPTVEELTDHALAGRPEVAAVRDRIEARAIGVELAQLEGRPGLRPMASYNSMWTGDAHRWMVGLGVSLPVWRQRIDAGIAEADAMLATEYRRLEALEDRIAAEVSIAVQRLAESRHVASLFLNRLLPAARDQARAAQSGFETGQVDFLALIDAERNLREVELGLAAAEADVRRRVAALKQAIGLLPADPWPLSNDQVPAPSTPSRGDDEEEDENSERTSRAENES